MTDNEWISLLSWFDRERERKKRRARCLILLAIGVLGILLLASLVVGP